MYDKKADSTTVLISVIDTCSLRGFGGIRLLVSSIISQSISSGKAESSKVNKTIYYWDVGRFLLQQLAYPCHSDCSASHFYCVIYQFLKYFKDLLPLFFKTCGMKKLSRLLAEEALRLDSFSVMLGVFFPSKSVLRLMKDWFISLASSFFSSSSDSMLGVLSKELYYYNVFLTWWSYTVY